MADSVASTSSQPQSSSQDNATTSQAGNVASPPNPDKQTKKNVTTGNKANAKHGGRREETPDVRASKALSYILRHGAAKEGLKLRPDGFVKVDDLLKRPKLQKENVDLPTLQRIVSENAKQRFALREEIDSITGKNVLWIRANQGHSIEVEDLELSRIEKAEDIPVVVHGSFSRHWDSIKNEGLKSMTRHHIHCASGLYGQEGVISGMRASCDLFIEIDVPKAMQDGIIFEKSANGVILTKGKKGVLAPEYFKQVKNKKGEILYP